MSLEIIINKDSRLKKVAPQTLACGETFICSLGRPYLVISSPDDNTKYFIRLSDMQMFNANYFNGAGLVVKQDFKITLEEV